MAGVRPKVTCDSLLAAKAERKKEKKNATEHIVVCDCWTRAGGKKKSRGTKKVEYLDFRCSMDARSVIFDFRRISVDIHRHPWECMGIDATEHIVVCDCWARAGETKTSNN